MKRILCLFQLSIVVLFSQFLYGQNAGDLDPSFGDGGKLLINCDNDAKINDMEILDNGQILVAGSCASAESSEGMMVLLNEDGSIDTSFGDDGFVYISYEDFAFTEIDAIKVSSSNFGNWWAQIEFGAKQLNDQTRKISSCQIDSNGDINPSFGDQGFIDPCEANSFAGMWLTTEPEFSLYIACNLHPTDGISEVDIRKLTAAGLLDIDFGDNGLTKVVDLSGNDHDIIGTSLKENNQKLVLVGYEYMPETSTQEAFAAAFNTDGTPQTSFGNQGIWLGNLGSAAFIQGADMTNNNSIFLGGSVWNGDLAMYDKLIIKLTSSGELDTQFGNGGYSYDSGDDADIEDIKKILDRMYVTGEIYTLGKSSGEWQTSIFLTRYLEDGSVDETFGDNGDVITDFEAIYNYANVIKVYADKILVGGYKNNAIEQSMALARYLNDINVSVDNHKENTVGVKIYPLPADKFVTVELNGNIKDKYSVSIMNTLGQVVYQADNSMGPDVKKLTLSTTELSPGLNTVRIENSENVITKKLLIVN